MNFDINNNNTHTNMHNFVKKMSTISEVINRVNNDNIENRDSSERNTDMKIKMLEMMTKIMSRLNKLEEASRSRIKVHKLFLVEICQILVNKIA